MTNTIKGVLFDLDGTLLDTAPDLIFALNKLRQHYALSPLPVAEVLPYISLGSISLIKELIGLHDAHPELKNYQAKLFDIYQQHLADNTTFYPEMETVLQHLDHHHIPWGIVTNKLTRHTVEILKALAYEQRPLCVVCGDTLSTYKPDPAPILHACDLLKKNPDECLFVGDSMSDVIAGNKAGTKTLVALYGYIPEGQDAKAWQATGLISKPIEILDWL